MIATDAPSSAAARAARWPARPAPMIRTSCAGMAESLYTAVRENRPAPAGAPPAPPPGRPLARPGGGEWAGAPRPGEAGGEGPTDLLERHDAAQPLLGVDD